MLESIDKCVIQFSFRFISLRSKKAKVANCQKELKVQHVAGFFVVVIFVVAVVVVAVAAVEHAATLYTKRNTHITYIISNPYVTSAQHTEIHIRNLT